MDGDLSFKDYVKLVPIVSILKNVIFLLEDLHGQVFSDILEVGTVNSVVFKDFDPFQIGNHLGEHSVWTLLQRELKDIHHMLEFLFTSMHGHLDQ
jgi:hypothetical protein